MKRIAISLLITFCTTAFSATHIDSLLNDSIMAIDNVPAIKKSLSNRSNQPCTAMLKDLVLVKIQYWGFDDKEHSGFLIVHKTLGEDVVGIFNELRVMRFPIQALQPIPKALRKMPNIYDNTTDSFSCRYVTDQPGIMSQHSYGRAIDINPLLNPYVKGCLIVPAKARKHIDRIRPEKGKIIPNSAVTAIFAKYGWDWGGNWHDAKDYQHIEKRANNQKRDPFGYVTGRFRYESMINTCE